MRNARSLFDQAKEPVVVVRADGTSFKDIDVIYQYGIGRFVVLDPEIRIQTGDEIRRPTRGGHEEVWVVVDPTYRRIPKGMRFEQLIGEDFYHPQVRRAGEKPKGTGGNYEIAVNGDQSRVMIGSEDHSVNIIDASRAGELIDKIAAAINEVEADPSVKTSLNGMLDDMRSASTKDAFREAYNRFIASVSAHVTLLTAAAPFLPALNNLL
ncbi:MAG: hypothetical protein AAGH42_10015 [Pseudomonadota bacterium]